MLNSQVALYRLTMAVVTLKASILTVWNFNGIFNSAPKKLIVPPPCPILSDDLVDKRFLSPRVGHMTIDYIKTSSHTLPKDKIFALGGCVSVPWGDNSSE